MGARWKHSDFHHLEEIARGQAGSIHLVKEKKTGKRFVLKKRLKSECRSDAEHEARLLTKIKHPNVIKCHGYFKTSSLGRSPVYIVLEYAVRGDLRRLIRERKEPFDEIKIWTMYRQILRGLQHLHSYNIVHRDVKSSNIFLMRNGRRGFRCVLGDFGVSRERSETTKVLTTFYGTPLYASPELIRSEPYNEKTDVWSCGVVFYELATLKFPFYDKNLLSLAKKIERGKYKPIRRHSPMVSRVIDLMLQTNPESRASTSELLTVLGDDDDNVDNDMEDTESGEEEEEKETNSTTEDEEEEEEEEEEEKDSKETTKNTFQKIRQQRPKSRRDIRWERRRNSNDRGREHVVIEARRHTSSLLPPRFGRCHQQQRPSTASSSSSSFFSTSRSGATTTTTRTSISTLERLQRLSLSSSSSRQRRPQSKRTSGWFLH
jgi:NIMA (never in mitosis gene a)-related kinase 1/4/5